MRNVREFNFEAVRAPSYRATIAKLGGFDSQGRARNSRDLWLFAISDLGSAPSDINTERAAMASEKRDRGLFGIFQMDCSRKMIFGASPV
jgi:hypothetical protein